jgi:hypothetical protein
MSLFRRLILVALTATAFMAPLASFTPQAQAGYRQQHYYYVYYRECASSPWMFYGAYTNIYDAEFVAYYFMYYGYEAFVR